jgi:hypothetical protein
MRMKRIIRSNRCKDNIVEVYNFFFFISKDYHCWAERSSLKKVAKPTYSTIFSPIPILLNSKVVKKKIFFFFSLRINLSME